MVGYYTMGYICTNMAYTCIGELHKYNIGQNEPDTKKSILEDYIKFKNKP